MARFAIKTATHHIEWAKMLEIWRAADQIDLFESAWNFDHFYPIVGDTDGPCLEAWVTLSALAQATTRIRVGTMVNGMHYRHPAVTANMAASLDIVSDGRFELGLGAGWNELESGAYGIELGSIGERMTRFEEGVEVIDLLLRQEHSDFAGEHFTLTNARNEPKSIQKPRPPIVIGGRGEKRTLRLVARFASMWDTFLKIDEPDDWLRLRGIMWQHCADVGRDPAEVSCSSHLRVGPGQGASEVADIAARMLEIGVDVVIVGMNTEHGPGFVEELGSALEGIR